MKYTVEEYSITLSEDTTQAWRDATGWGTETRAAIRRDACLLSMARNGARIDINSFNGQKLDAQQAHWLW